VCPSLSQCSWSHQVKPSEMGWARRLAGARRTHKTAKEPLISSSPMPSSWTGPESIRCVYSCHSSHSTLDGLPQADIGIRDGIIVSIGKSGNPDNMDCIHPCLVIGASTEVIAGEKLIITAGAIDAHVHYICPQLVPKALMVGMMTVIKRGTGPSTGTNATMCTSSSFISSIYWLRQMVYQ